MAQSLEAAPQEGLPSRSSSTTLNSFTEPIPPSADGREPAPTVVPKHGEKAWMQSDKEQDAMPYNNYYLVMPSLMLVLFLAALDQTIVCEYHGKHFCQVTDTSAATALPTIAEKFHATSSQVSS